MKASLYLVTLTTSVHSGEAIPVGIKDPHAKVSVLGSSVPVSVNRGTPVSTFAIYPDREGVVAVWIDSKPRHAFFVGVVSAGSDENGPLYRLDIDSMWVPVSGRIGQAYDHGMLSVVIGGEEYHTNDAYLFHGPYVPDGNLLCRYLAGHVDAEAVKLAAVEAEQESSAREKLDQAQQVIAAMLEASRQAAGKLRAYDALEERLRSSGLLDPQCGDISFLEGQFMERFDSIQNSLESLRKDCADLRADQRTVYEPLAVFLRDMGLFDPWEERKIQRFQERLEAIRYVILKIRSHQQESMWPLVGMKGCVDEALSVFLAEPWAQVFLDKAININD